MNSFTFHFSYMVSIQCTFLHGFKNVRQMKVFIYCLHLTEFSLEWVLSQEYERKSPNFSHLHDVHHLASLKCHVTKAFQYSLRSVSVMSSFMHLNITGIAEGFTIFFCIQRNSLQCEFLSVFRINWDNWKFSYISYIHRPTFHYECSHGFEQN